MATLVFLEHHGDELSKASLGVLSKAAFLGDSDVAGVIAGSDVRALGDEAGKFGAAKVYVADDRRACRVVIEPLDLVLGVHRELRQ